MSVTPVIYGPGVGDAADKAARPVGFATSTRGALTVAARQFPKAPWERWSARRVTYLDGTVAYSVAPVLRARSGRQGDS